MSKPVCLLSVIALLLCLAACAACTGDGGKAGTREEHGEDPAVGVEFDANGDETVCGAAAIDTTAGTVTIANTAR